MQKDIKDWSDPLDVNFMVRDNEKLFSQITAQEA